MERKPTVTILAPSLHTNAMGRTRVIEGLLEPEFNVEVFGLGNRQQLWEPLRADSWQPAGDYDFHGFWGLRTTVNDLSQRIRGDVILCTKPLPASFGVGLLLARRKRLPLILDIDDWEPGFLARSALWELRFLRAKWFLNPLSPFYTRLLDSLTHKASGILVSNTLLQGLYGGVWIPHARDMRAFPQTDARPPARADARRMVLFAGSAKSHKGIGTIAAAWPLVCRDSTVLVLLGTRDDATDERLASIRNRPDVIVKDSTSYLNLVQELLAASVVVVPQDNAPESVGQLPMKLLDAMAAARPIVASDVGDIPRWLRGNAGICVSPGDPSDLARGIQRMLDEPQFAETCGRNARHRVETMGSSDVVGLRLRSAVKDVLAGRKPLGLPAFSGDPALMRGQ